MSIFNKYINWQKMWNEEHLLKTEYIKEEYHEVWDQFVKDNNVELIDSECSYDQHSHSLIFFFSETGGRNESDNVGWSRDYYLSFDVNDFDLNGIEYQQG